MRNFIAVTAVFFLFSVAVSAQADSVAAKIDLVVKRRAGNDSITPEKMNGVLQMLNNRVKKTESLAVPLASKGQVNGVAPLNSAGQVPAVHIPAHQHTTSQVTGLDTQLAELQAKANADSTIAANNVNSEYLERRRVDDSLKNAVNGSWKLAGNDFFTNSIYNIGIKTGVNVAASTNPYVFMPANRLVLGINTSNVNDNTGLDRVTMVLDANGLSFNSTSSRMKTGMEVTAESFALCRTNNGSNVKGLQGNFANSNNSTLSLSNVQYGLPSTSSTVFTTSIFAFDSLSLVGNVWNTAWGTSPVSGNSSLILNKRGGKGYIFKDGIFQEIAFAGDVVSSKTQLPIAPSHAFADQYLPAHAFYKLSVNSADLGGASARTVFQK